MNLSVFSYFLYLWASFFVSPESLSITLSRGLCFCLSLVLCVVLFVSLGPCILLCLSESVYLSLLIFLSRCLLFSKFLSPLVSLTLSVDLCYLSLWGCASLSVCISFFPDVYLSLSLSPSPLSSPALSLALPPLMFLCLSSHPHVALSLDRTYAPGS